MKIQQTQTNVGFGNQYAVYERTVTKGLKPLGIPTKAVRHEIGRLIQPISTIEQGEGLFIFRQGRVNYDKTAIILSGSHVNGQKKDGAAHLSYDGEGTPVEITFPRNAEPEIIKQRVLTYLKDKLNIN